MLTLVRDEPIPVAAPRTGKARALSNEEAAAVRVSSYVAGLTLGAESRVRGCLEDANELRRLAHLSAHSAQVIALAAAMEKAARDLTRALLAFDDGFCVHGGRDLPAPLALSN
jgi:hypothetical protein